MEPDLIQRTLTRLRDVERLALTPEQGEALENVRSVLSFIDARSAAAGFSDYVEHFDTIQLTPVLSFGTRDEAETWLRTHPAPPNGALIGAADALYTLSYSRELDHRKLLRFQTDEALASGEIDDTATAEEEEAPSPPHPSLERRFKFFGFFTWTVFHLHLLERRTSSPEASQAIDTARRALHFVMHVGEEHGFEEYLRTLHAARSAPPVRSFTTREEADTWLAQQPEPPPPAVIAIGGELHSVGYDRVRRLRVLLRLPTRQEWKPHTP
jgi:hypothetical protein